MKRRVFMTMVAVYGISMAYGAEHKHHHHEDGHKHHNHGDPKDFRAVSPDKAEILQKSDTSAFCSVCGMTLTMYYRTNHAATVNGEVHQYCSLHCLLEEAYEKKIEPKDIKVVDNVTLKFMDANKAYYVVGSKQPATMDSVSKYAFSSEDEAKKFAKEYGGEIMRFDQVRKATQANLVKSIEEIRARQAKMAKMGEKIYNKVCKKTSERFKTTGEAKAYLVSNKLCGDLKGKKLQQVGLFLSGR